MRKKTIICPHKLHIGVIRSTHRREIGIVSYTLLKTSKGKTPDVRHYL